MLLSGQIALLYRSYIKAYLTERRAEIRSGLDTEREQIDKFDDTIFLIDLSKVR